MSCSHYARLNVIAVSAVAFLLLIPGGRVLGQESNSVPASSDNITDLRR